MYSKRTGEEEKGREGKRREEEGGEKRIDRSGFLKVLVFLATDGLIIRPWCYQDTPASLMYRRRSSLPLLVAWLLLLLLLLLWLRRVQDGQTCAAVP